MKPPKILNKMIDLVLAYRPESKVKPPRQRKKSTKKVSQDAKGHQTRIAPQHGQL